MTTSQFKQHFHCNKFIAMNSLTLTFSEKQKGIIIKKPWIYQLNSNEFFYLISKYFIVFGK